MPAIAPIKILKPKVNPRKIPVIDAIKIETIKVIPKIVSCNFVYSSFLENKFSNWVVMFNLLRSKYLVSQILRISTLNKNI